MALPNTTEEGPRRRFLVRPSDYRLAERRATELGGELLGFYHSHPDHPARPSQYDLDHAWPTFAYIIVAGGRRQGRGHDRVVSQGRSIELRRGQPSPWRKFSFRHRFDRTPISRTPSTPRGATVGELLADLTHKHAGLKAHLYNEQGKLRSFVNVYVNDEDIRYLQKEQTPVNAADTVSIIPSVAGGVRLPPKRTAGRGTAEPGVSKTPLTNDEIKRYSRHLIMPEVGVDGQRKLKAGEGALHRRRRTGFAGGDVSRRGRRRHASASSTSTSSISATCSVRSSTARRTSDGRSSRRRRIGSTRSIPNIDIQTHEVALSSQNAMKLFEPYDVIVDGTDNFPTRYLVNDACVLLGKPNAYGSIFRFEGQASVFATKDGPCYRCLYPEPPPPGLVPSCAEGGVLGVLPGIIGVIQATETVKLIMGIGEPLIGRFLIYDALRMKFRELKLRKDPDCPVCGTHPTVTQLIDYEQFCGIVAGQRRSRSP